MFPSAPRPGPFDSVPDVAPLDLPEPAKQGITMAAAAYIAVSAYIPSVLMFVGPYATALVLHPSYRESLAAPVPGARRASAAASRNTVEFLSLLGAMPAMYWAVAMMVSLACLFHPYTRAVGRIGLLVGLLILLATIGRYALYASTGA